jgi:peptidoglycan/LPS O-acetylase OafA/YrhL
MVTIAFSVDGELLLESMQHDHLPHLSYRPEVDGLRAVAVLSVILFHAGVTGLPGGFTGVDIFFVISGFLITKIIVNALRERRFSFMEFYARRFKRLMPAALFMLLTTVVFGYWILTPDKYVELAKSAVYASLFLANVWFANNSGYFDQAAEVSPLIHMWSLAVEEQFYLLFPLFILVSFKAGGMRGVRFAILALLVASLAASILFSAHYPNGSFYLLPTRAWQLCAGALLVFLPWQRLQLQQGPDALFITGALLIASAVVFLDAGLTYPGWLALLPVAGACLLIVSAHTPTSIGNRILSLPPLVLVGRFSYSAYLWHWPIVSYYRVYVSERQFTATETASLILASLVSGYLSYRFIEERFRYAKLPASKTIIIGGTTVAAMAAVPFAVYLLQGFPHRISIEAQSITDMDLMWKWECTEKIRPFRETDESFCVVGAPWDAATAKGLVWGDSHSLHWAPVLEPLARERGLSLLIAPLECPPYLNAAWVQESYPKFPNFTDTCTQKHLMTVAWLQAESDVSLIIMAAAWSGHLRQLYAADDAMITQMAAHATESDRKSEHMLAQMSQAALRATLDAIAQSGREVLLLGDVPRPNRNLNECAFNEFGQLLRAHCKQPHDFLAFDEVRTFQTASNNVLRAVGEQRPDATAIIPTSLMCDEARCDTYLNGELLYKDSNHIRRNLSKETLGRLGVLLGLPNFLDGVLSRFAGTQTGT